MVGLLKRTLKDWCFAAVIGFVPNRPPVHLGVGDDRKHHASDLPPFRNRHPRL